MKGIFGGLFLLVFISISVSLPLSKTKKLLIEPKTVKYHASYYKPDMTITSVGMKMHFPGGGGTLELFRVPLGRLEPHSVIQITVALTSDTPTTFIGLSDGVHENTFYINRNGRCTVSGGYLISANIPSGAKKHNEYTLLLEPFQKFAACSHIGDHITTGSFSSGLDINKGLDFIVKRGSSSDACDFYYFIIEIF